MANGTVAFSFMAPRLPPITRMRIAPLRLREALDRRRHVENFLAHRIADGARLRAGIEAVRERGEHFLRQRREAAIREAGNGVLLMNHERRTREPRSDSTRTRHETTQPDDDHRADAYA